jgi:hypothetical protein
LVSNTVATALHQLGRTELAADVVQYGMYAPAGAQQSLRQTAVFQALGDLLRQALPCYLTPELVAAEAEVRSPPHHHALR